MRLSHSSFLSLAFLSIVSSAVLTTALPASALETRPMTPVKESAAVETLFANRDSVRMCVETCHAIYGRPGPELKQCLAKCRRSAR